MNQTVALRVWILADYCAAQIILMAIPQDKVVVFEMYKLIFVDNILYRFLVPIIFIFYTKKTLPELWSDKSLKKVDFYLSRQIIAPRRPSYSLESSTELERGNDIQPTGVLYIYVESNNQQ